MVVGMNLDVYMNEYGELFTLDEEVISKDNSVKKFRVDLENVYLHDNYSMADAIVDLFEEFGDDLPYWIQRL